MKRIYGSHNLTTCSTLLLGLLCVVSALTNNCNELSDSCVSCIEEGCKWCPDQGCFTTETFSSDGCKPSDWINYEDKCPVSWSTVPSFLPNWMGNMNVAIGNLTLLDISLPGTHDTLTYDLSTTVSDGGADDYYLLAELLHKFDKIIPTGLEDWIRQQSQTQELNITSQLDNGVRFVDFRQMYEYSDRVHPDWHSLHFMQSINTATTYYTQIRQWLDVHPKEIVVLWISKHGNECAAGEDQYPKVSIEEKQAYWGTITSVFDGLLTNFTQTKINETSINDMIKQNQRVVLYVSDYQEFTGGSELALDGCLIDNHLGPGVSDEPDAVEWERAEYQNAEATKAVDKPLQKLYLQSLSTGVPAKQTEKAAKIKWLPYDDDDIQECADAFGIPGMFWCPETLLDVAQLSNYFKQITLEEAINTPGWGFPNAIYINALDWEGTVRIGTQVLWGGDRDGSAEEFKTKAYAYVDTLLLYNLNLGCGDGTEDCDDCAAVRQILQDRRAMNPATYWDDAVYGRLLSWPA